MEDLGWLCVNSWRFGNSDLPVGGFGEIDDLLGAYRNGPVSNLLGAVVVLVTLGLGLLKLLQVFG